MYKIATDSRTLETELKSKSGTDFCTIKDVQAATGLSYKQVRERLGKALEPLPHTKPYRYLARHAAQVITGGSST